MMSDHEHRRLLERTTQAGARTPSAYIRAAALTGREFKLPAWETLRDVRNELIQLRLAIGMRGVVSKKLEEACVSAMDRISRF